jgi:hypothetical protein
LVRIRFEVRFHSGWGFMHLGPAREALMAVVESDVICDDDGTAGILALSALASLNAALK